MARPSKNAMFVCYSHADREYRERFDKFLKAEALNQIRIFSDAEIAAGDHWLEKIVENLEKATAALILVSQDFMISPFIQQVELRALLEKHVRRGLRLFLVPLWPTLYQGSPLERFQWALPPDKPLSAMPENEQRQAMINVCLQIAKQLGTLPDTPTIERTIEGLRSIPPLDLPSTYELQGHLGEGEFASCYRARDRLLNRPVIIKILKTQLARDSAAYDKYVESASRLDHEGILGVYFSQADKLPNFIVTPDVGDETLEKKMARRKKRPTFDQALDWTISLASTLGYAHAKNCVHGRLRPCEIRFDDKQPDQPVLAGFRTIESCERTASPVAGQQLDLETFLYASPEFRKHGRIDPKGDQYMLGLIAYEMITGSPPVRIENWAAVLDGDLARSLLHPRPVKEVVPSCDDRVGDVVMRMLSDDPAARWKSMSEVHRRLDDARSNASSVEEAKRSYRRIARDVSFYRELYKRLFKEIDGIEAMFGRKRTMAEQYDVLRDALWLLLTYPSTSERKGPTILSRIAHTHQQFDKKWFNTFRDVVLAVVGRRDPARVSAWKYAMEPGIEYLRTRAGKRPRPGA